MVARAPLTSSKCAKAISPRHLPRKKPLSQIPLLSESPCMFVHHTSHLSSQVLIVCVCVLVHVCLCLSLCYCMRSGWALGGVFYFIFGCV